MKMPEARETEKTISPFERLAKRFNEFPEPRPYEPNSSYSKRKKILSDGTLVELNFTSRWGLGVDIEKYTVKINDPFPYYGDVDRTNPSISFSIGKERLVELYTHQFITIGSAELITNRSLIAEKSSVETEQSRRNAKACEEAGKALVDWLDEVLITNKFTKPPVNISLW